MLPTFDADLREWHGGFGKKFWCLTVAIRCEEMAEAMAGRCAQNGATEIITVEQRIAFGGDGEGAKRFAVVTPIQGKICILLLEQGRFSA